MNPRTDPPGRNGVPLWPGLPTVPPNESGALEDPRLFRAVQEYQAAVEEGQRPDRAALLAQYPDLADALAECLDGLDLVYAGANDLGETPTRGGSGRRGAALAGQGMPPNPLGDYHIERELGRGGMGVVYEAVQLSLGRKVALKVLPFAAALDARHLQRFKTEAQAAAQLRHAHIVPVYGVGCEQGVHFYAMQIIEGQTLAALIDEMRRGTGVVGRGRAFFRRAAEFGIQAAEALEHAHQQGVIHRDVKPANLMVDPAGKLWVTDFGLAQFANDTNLTLTGDLLGTLRYMSPEQTLGKRVVLDARTDVYSLGATLYELLALEPAHGGGDRHEVLRRIAEEEPRPVRAYDPAVPVDLETVVLKAMAKSPGDRYASAQELADDLRRFLHDRPVLARRPSLGQRLTKWARRHKSMVMTAAAVLVLAVVGLSVSTALIAGAHRQTKAMYEQMRIRADEANAQHARAEANFQQAWRAVDAFAQLGEAEPQDHGPSLELRQRVLEAALTYYQAFVTQRQDDPDAQSELAATRERVARLVKELAAVQAGREIVPLVQSLTHKDVRDDLGLTAAQTRRFEEVTRGLPMFSEGGFDSLAKLGPDQRRARMSEESAACERILTDLLTPAQAKRLRQIALQMYGREALNDPDVADALGLTTDQRGQLRAGWENSHHGPGPRPGGRPGGGPDGREGRRSPRPNDAAAVENLLTPEQRIKWNELTGEPFRGEPFSLPGRFGPPPGPRPGG